MPGVGVLQADRALGLLARRYCLPLVSLATIAWRQLRSAVDSKWRANLAQEDQGEPEGHTVRAPHERLA
jgi:hypothetical protein